MSELINTVMPISLPAARLVITIRPATMDDLPFMDRLQKMHANRVGLILSIAT